MHFGKNDMNLRCTQKEGLPEVPMDVLLQRLARIAKLAPGKARTWAMFWRPSGALKDVVNCRRSAALSVSGFVAMHSGLSNNVNEHHLNAIGISPDLLDYEETSTHAGFVSLRP